MSDADFYKDNSQRYIKFHNHFLSEYADIIAKNPKVGTFHYDNLVHFYVAVVELVMLSKHGTSL